MRPRTERAGDRSPGRLVRRAAALATLVSVAGVTTSATSAAFAALATFAAVGLTACGSGSSDGGAATPTPGTAPTPTPDATAAPSPSVAPTPGPTGLRLVEIANGLEQPLFLTFAPGDAE